MSEDVLCAVAGVGLFTREFGDCAVFERGEPASEPLVPAGALLDKHARRRASDLSKGFAEAYKQALEQAGFEASTVGAVFGSALGEASITLGLLDQMFAPAGGGALSPMRFAASVHNAASGVVSIGTKNMGFTTAIGADYDTAAMALIEGIAYVATHDQPAIVVCGDEAAPANLVQGDQGWEFLTSAVALAPHASAASGLPRITAPALGVGGDWAGPALSKGLAFNPVVGLLDLIAALKSGGQEAVRLDRGRGRGFGTRIVRQV